jgi:hypothetical protein
MAGTKKQLPFGSRPNLFLKSHQNLVFRQEKVQILKVFRYWIFSVLRQDNEGFRDRQHFFQGIGFGFGLICLKFSLRCSGFQRISLFWFFFGCCRFSKDQFVLVFLRMLPVFKGSIHFGFSSDADGFYGIGSFARFNNTKMRSLSSFT